MSRSGRLRPRTRARPRTLGPAELLNSPPSSASGICTAVAAAVSIATFAEIGFGGLFVSHDLLVFFGADNQGRKEADGREATGDHEVNVAVAKMLDQHQCDASRGKAECDGERHRD